MLIFTMMYLNKREENRTCGLSGGAEYLQIIWRCRLSAGYLVVQTIW